MPSGAIRRRAWPIMVADRASPSGITAFNPFQMAEPGPGNYGPPVGGDDGRAALIQAAVEMQRRAAKRRQELDPLVRAVVERDLGREAFGREATVGLLGKQLDYDEAQRRQEQAWKRKDVEFERGTPEREAQMAALRAETGSHEAATRLSEEQRKGARAARFGRETAAEKATREVGEKREEREVAAWTKQADYEREALGELTPETEAWGRKLSLLPAQSPARMSEAQQEAVTAKQAQRFAAAGEAQRIKDEALSLLASELDISPGLIDQLLGRREPWQEEGLLDWSSPTKAYWSTDKTIPVPADSADQALQRAAALLKARPQYKKLGITAQDVANRYRKLD